MRIWGLNNERILLKARFAAQVEAEAGPDASGSALSLLQVGLGCPHGGVVGHVVMGSK